MLHRLTKKPDRLDPVLELRLSILLRFLVLLFSFALALSVLENRLFFDAVYFSIITLTTIGFGDLTPTTELGKILTIILAVTGVPFFIGVTTIFLERRARNFIEIHLAAVKKEVHETETKLEKIEKEISPTKKSAHENPKKSPKKNSQKSGVRQRFSKLFSK